MMLEDSTFAPGARVLIRDEEWLIKRGLHGGTSKAVRVVGLSELVRGQEAVFLAELDEIKELQPEDTIPAEDDSPRYRRSRLYLESLLRRTPPTDTDIYLGHDGAIDYAPYQLQPAKMALDALRARILIADGVGLGKTVEAGILLSELIKRGRGERILVVAIRSMLAQFQQEIWARFAIPLVRLDSVGLQRVRAKIPSSKNPFTYYDRVIISVDTLKNDAQYRHYLEQCHWDIILIDECQNVANLGSQRNRLATLLARTCDSMILTSATPHNGRAESFANLMNMLEPTAIADRHDYTASEIEGLFVRRFKKDIEDQVKGQFSERTIEQIRIRASPDEEAFFDALATASFRSLHRHRRGRDALYRIGLLKGFLSSPDACLQTLRGRLKRIEKHLRGLRGEIDQESAEGDAVDEDALEDAHWGEQLTPMRGEQLSQWIRDLAQDKETLQELTGLAEAVTPAKSGKYQRLLELLRELGVDASPDSPRVIIFTERLPTLRFLLDNLRQELGASEESMVLFHGGLPDTQQQELVEDFGKKDSKIRILLATDVGSEGVNLHYCCHLMIHFDIPWSLITLEQRNGRIDRYGQKVPPRIYYLLMTSENQEFRGDLRVVDKLIEKENEAHKNIGEAASILGLYSAQREEEEITKGVAAGKGAEEILDTAPEGLGWLEILEGAVGDQAAVDADHRASSFSLYKDDLAFARAAFEELAQAGDLDARCLPDYHPDRPEFTLLAPEDLRRRCEFIPQEAMPPDGIFHLSTDRQRIMEAIDEARKRKREWPSQQLFWELHPVMEWLMDKLLVCFRRHEAPVVIAPQLPADDVIFLFQGIFSNKRSQPVISDWFGIRMETATGASVRLSFDEALAAAGFGDGLPNPGWEARQKPKIPALLPSAVDQARQHMMAMRLARGQLLRKRLQADQRKLNKWYQASLARIEAQESGAIHARLAKLRQERKDVEGLYRQRAEWLTESLSAEPQPYLRVALVFAGS